MHMQTYTYWLVLLGSFIVPFACSFYPKKPFYKVWKHLFPALFLTGIFFVAWDHYFTVNEVWGFNDEYICGFKLLSLPIEEILFFAIIPYCCIFIYEALNYYFGEPNLSKRALTITNIFLTLGLALLALQYSEQAYTFTTCFFSVLLLLILQFIRVRFLAKFYRSYLVSLIPFFIVNGILTALPVVVYNDSENLGIRLFTIPADDLIYSFLMLLMTTAWMEFFRKRSTV